jgi:hypothetical protein
MNAWTHEPYQFVFIPVGSSVFEDVKALTSIALSGAHTISSRDPLVSKAVDSFSLALRVFVNVMKAHELADGEKQSAKKHCADILNFVHETDCIPTLQLPAEELLFRLGSFEAGVCPGPGGRVDVASLKGHPASCPWLLQARNANSWFTFLWSKRGLGDERFLGDRGLEAVRTRPESSSAKGCVLFPACSDVPGFASCDLCLSRHVCGSAWMFPDLSSGEAEAVERIRAASAEEDDAEVLDALRRTLIIDVGDFPDSDDDNWAVPEGARWFTEEEHEAEWATEVVDAALVGLDSALMVAAEGEPREETSPLAISAVGLSFASPLGPRSPVRLSPACLAVAGVAESGPPCGDGEESPSEPQRPPTRTRRPDRRQLRTLPLASLSARRKTSRR